MDRHSGDEMEPSRGVLEEALRRIDDQFDDFKRTLVGLAAYPTMRPDWLLQ